MHDHGPRVRIHRAYTEGSRLKVIGPCATWTVTMISPQRALTARNWIRFNGIPCNDVAVRDFLLAWGLSHGNNRSMV